MTKSGIPWIINGDYCLFIPRVTCIFSIETAEVKHGVHDGKFGRITIENTTAFSCVAVFSMVFCVYLLRNTFSWYI